MGKKQQITNISEMAEDLNIKFRMQIGIIKSHQFSKIGQKKRVQNAKNSILKKIPKIGITPKRLELDTISKSSEIVW